jgi:hypothetical protein
VGYFALAIAYCPEPENSCSALSKAYAIVYNDDLRHVIAESAIVFKWLIPFNAPAYSLLAAFAAGICLLTGRDAFMRTICARTAGALPRRVFLA